MSNKSAWVGKVIWFVFLCVLGALVLVFGSIGGELTPWSQAIVNDIAKFWYPDVKREETTVVLFREENLKELNESYPVSYWIHAEVLQALLTYRPRAVFVDFIFLDKRGDDTGGLDALHKAICGFGKKNIPLYLAVPSTGKIRPELNPDVNPCVDPGKDLNKAELVTAQMERPDGSSGVLDYQLEGETAYGVKSSPAWAMLPREEKECIVNLRPIQHSLKSWEKCKKRTEQKKQEEQKEQSEQADQTAKKDLTAPTESMEIIWPSGDARKIHNWMGCKPRNKPSELQDVLYEGPLSNSRKLECPYTPTVSVRHVLDSIRDKEVTGALEGRSVFYGAGFQAAGDILTSPVYRELPAVYLHAVAHDNLLTLKNNYKSAERPEEWLTTATLINWFLLFVIVFIVLFPEKVIELLTKRLIYSSTQVSVIRSERYRWLYLVALRRRETRLRYGSKWLPLGIAVIWLAFVVLLELFFSQYWHAAWYTAFRNAFLYLTVLGISGLFGLFALGYLNTSTAPYPNGSEDFRELRKKVDSLVGPLLLGGAFLFFYVWVELDRALLLSLLFYVFYKLFFAKDQLFVITVVLLIFASLVSFWPLNFGPRNIIAYFIFFEVARYLIEHASEVAKKFYGLQAKYPSTDARWPWWGRDLRFNPLKVFCELSDREVKDAQEEEAFVSSDARRAASGAGNRRPD